MDGSPTVLNLLDVRIDPAHHMSNGANVIMPPLSLTGLITCSQGNKKSLEDSKISQENM